MNRNQTGKITGKNNDKLYSEKYEMSRTVCLVAICHLRRIYDCVCICVGVDCTSFFFYGCVYGCTVVRAYICMDASDVAFVLHVRICIISSDCHSNY